MKKRIAIVSVIVCLIMAIANVSAYNWLADINLTNDAPCDGNEAIAVAPDGGIHIVWARDTGSPPSGGDHLDTLYYLKSTDGGVTWSPMKPISYAGPQIPDQNVQVPAMAIDSTGRIHVVWHGTNPSGILNRVIYSKSEDKKQYSS